MLSVAADVYQNGVSKTPLSFEIDSANLILRDGTEIDITMVISKIKIIESIQRVATLINISIVDTFDYIDLFKLDGTEKINFVISRKEFVGLEVENKKIERTVTIASIVDYNKPKPGTLAYTFSCIPEYAYLNQYKTISKHVSGSVRENILTICKTDLKLKPEKDLHEDLVKKRGSTNCDAIIPLMKPLTAINWLLRHADDGGTPYYFYQTLDGLIFCRSKREMIEAGVYKTYTNQPFFQKAKPAENDATSQKAEYFLELQNIISIDRSEIKMSKYISGAEGAYGSTIHHLDISTKKYKPDAFKFRQHNLLNENKPLADDSVIANNKIDTLTSGKNNFYSTNSLAFSNNIFSGVPTGPQNYHSNAGKKGVAEAYSHKALNDITSQRFELPGDFDLHAGKIINLEILRIAEEEDLSELLSGNHLVTTVEHHFDLKGYKMVVSAKKDSFIKTLNEREIANES